jgi:hypothetical protein
MIVVKEKPVAVQSGNLENVSIFKKILKLLHVSAINKELEDEEMDDFSLQTMRNEELESIVLDQKCSISWWNLLWCLLGLVLNVAVVVLTFSIWPTQNVFIHQEYWYQCILQCAIIYTGKLDYFLRSYKLQRKVLIF